MKTISALLGVFLAFAISLQAQNPPPFRQTPTLLGKPNSPKFHQPLPVQQNLAAIAIPQAKVAGVSPAACPESSASLCGFIPVPLDRSHPRGAQIQIYFELYPHTGPGPAQSAILANLGGPGVTTTGLRDYLQFFFASNLDAHDLLLVDDRGRGLSATIDCEELQHGTADFAPSETDCAAQLGTAASRYGTGDIAEDMEVVRKTLGYDQIDYFGASYGGADVTAYAVRFGKHLRSAVMDAPLSTPGMEELLRLHYRTNADLRMVRLDCQRSLLCSQDQSDPDQTLANLIQSIRQHPVEGDGHDVFGNVVHVRVDEDALLNFVVTYPSGAFVNTGEILAAGDALKRGDTVPLLRLAAEGYFTLVGDSGDPTFNSAGAFYATACMDAIEPWDWSAPVPDRMEQYSEAVAELPANYYFPFSRVAANSVLFSNAGKQCFWWEQPTPPTPIAPAHANYPAVPVLVLDGDLDNRVPYEETNQVAALFPNSTNVIVAGAGHEATGWTSCASNMASLFIETLQPGDASCAATPEVVWPAVGRFPLTVANARPASPDSSGTNQIATAERKTVSVAVATAIDALQRSLLNFGDGVGLRGGTFHTDYFGATFITSTTLTNCQFAADLIVNGTIAWGYDNSIEADLTVSGSGTAGGTLHFTGFFENPGAIGNFMVSGSLGGKNVAVLVPEA